MDIATLGLELRVQGDRQVLVAMKGVEDQAGKTEKATNRLESSFDGLSRAFRMLTPLAGALAGAFSARVLTQYADQWSDMRSVVGAAIRDMEGAPRMMERIVDIANASYSPLQQTADAYARNVGVLRDLGVGADGAADYVEALNHSLVLTATRGERAASVQNALAKAMAVGKLQADGLETVLANGGRVAEVLAEELGTNVSGLRELAAQGKITSEVIANSLISRVDQLGAAASKMDATVSDASVRIQTNFTALVGRVDQALGASQAFANSLVGVADTIGSVAEPAIAAAVMLADNFERLTFHGTAFATVMAVNYASAMVTAAGVTSALSGALVILRGAIAGTGIGLLVLLVTDVVYRIYDATVGVRDLGDTLEEVTKPGRSLFETLKIGAEATYATFEWLGAGIAAAMVGSFATVYRAYADLVNGINAGLRVFGINQRDMDRDWAGQIAQSLEHTRNQALRQMTHKWGQLFGGGDMLLGTFDALGGSSSFESIEEMWASLSAGGPLLTDLTTKANGLSEALGGSGQANPYAEATKSVLENIQALNQQALAFGLSETAATRFSTAMDLLRAAEEAKLPITASLIDQINMYADATATATERVRQMEQQQQLAISINNTLAQGFSNMFKGLIDGSKSAVQAIGDLLSQLGQLLINQAFMSLFGGGTAGGIGGFFSGLFSFNGGGFTGYGPRAGGVDGLGGFPAILHPNETVIDHTRPVMPRITSAPSVANDNRGGRGDVHITINGSGLTEEQLGRAIAQGLQDYDATLAPKVEAKFRVMQSDPRAADGNW